MWLCKPLIPELRQQKQTELCEFRVGLNYIENMRSSRERERERQRYRERDRDRQRKRETKRQRQTHRERGSIYSALESVLYL